MTECSGYEDDLNDHERVGSDLLLGVLAGREEADSRWPARAVQHRSFPTSLTR
jgi:hypothetical protein